MDVDKEKPGSTTVRRTRSGKVVRPVATPSKQSKPTARRTRKKVVLMEVEVSDDEDPTPDQEEKLEESLKISEDSVDVAETEEREDPLPLDNSNVDNDFFNISDDLDADDLINSVEIGTANLSKNLKDNAEAEILQTKNNEEQKEIGNVLKFKNISKPSNNEEIIKNSVKISNTEESSETVDSSNGTDRGQNVQNIEHQHNDKFEKETAKTKIEEKETNETNQVQKPDHMLEESKQHGGESDKSLTESDKNIESNIPITKPEILTSESEGKKSGQDVADESGSKLVEVSETEQTISRKEVADATKMEVEVEIPKPTEKISENAVTKEVLSESNTIDISDSDSKHNSTVVKDNNDETEPKPHVDSEKLNELQMEVDEGELLLTEEQNGVKEESNVKTGEKDNIQNGDPDAENISEDELPSIQVAKVPETEEVSDEELPGPKRAELPADTEVVSEDELPTVKKEGTKRKLAEGEYDPCSPTSEGEGPAKKPALEKDAEKEKDEKPAKPKKLPELDKFWKAVNDDPTDFTGWTYLLQYVDQENDMEAAREAYDAFLSHYPYCYGYWRKYADYEKRKGNKKKCEEVFERGLKAIPLSVDLWIHYLTYAKTSRTDDEEFVRSQFERALSSCGLEFRSDRLWDSYIKWETEAKRLQRVTSIFDRLLATPTQGYTAHFESFQEHITLNPPNKVVEVDEFLALRKEVRTILKHDAVEAAADNSDAPPGDEDPSKLVSSDEETKSIRERIISIRRKIHKNTVTAVSARWNYEEGIKRPYFHVKPLERCQLKNWQEYLDFEIAQGDKARTIVLFERCLIACALYEEFWLKFVHYLESLKEEEFAGKIRDVYERACTIHHLKKPNLHLQWAMFEESSQNFNRAAEILVNLEKSVPNVLQIAYRRINLERRRQEHDKCSQLFEQYISSFKSKLVGSNIAIKYSRFCLKVLKSYDKAAEVLKNAVTKDPNNPRLYLQQIDLTLQKEGVAENEVVEIIDSFLEKDSVDADQKILFAQRKLEYLEDFGGDILLVQRAYETYHKMLKQSKDGLRKKEIKSESASTKKEKSSTPSSAQSGQYGPYGNYGNSPAQGNYQYSGAQQQGQYNYPQYNQGEPQYQYQNWQYPQGGYGGYNQWGSYGGGYGY